MLQGSVTHLRWLRALVCYARVCRQGCKGPATANAAFRTPPAAKWQTSLRQQCSHTSASSAKASRAMASPTGVTEHSPLPPRESCNLRCTLLDVPGSLVDALADELLGSGAQTVSIDEFRPEGAPEQELFGADFSGERGLWHRCMLTVLYPPHHDVAEAVQLAEALLEEHDQGRQLQWSVEEVMDREWVEAVKASYQPLQLSEALWIVPDWLEPPDPAATNIIMQPGLAFGTGEHPTTRLCLQHLASLPLQGKTVMDYGTGSGVLAIAALLFGAVRAVGTDVDPLSVRAATANAELNGCGDRFLALPCDATTEGPEPLSAAGEALQTFDVCVSNILSGPLLELTPRIAAYVRPGGMVALSGVLMTQAPVIVEAYSRHFTGLQVVSQGSWALITGTKMQG